MCIYTYWSAYTRVHIYIYLNIYANKYKTRFKDHTIVKKVSVFLGDVIILNLYCPNILQNL